MGLDYNTQLKFEGINIHGGKIFKDNQGRYVVKIEDHLSADQVILMGNYQGDWYMAPERVMYLVTDDPDNVGPLGEVMEKMEKETNLEEPEENPPSIDMKEFRLLNSFHVKRVPIDDLVRALYTQWDNGDRHFYGGLHPKPNSLATKKTLYTFFPKSAKAMGVLIILDKFGQEWTSLDEAELETFTHMGKPVSFYFKLLLQRGDPRGIHFQGDCTC